MIERKSWMLYLTPKRGNNWARKKGDYKCKSFDPMQWSNLV